MAILVSSPGQARRMTIETLNERVTPLFLDGGVFHDRYDPPEDDLWEEVVPGGVWQTPVFPSGSDSAHLLRVYLLSNMSGELLRAHWRNETRTLLRLSSRGHRTLPRLHEAKLLPERELGYLVIDDTGRPLDDHHPLREVFVDQPTKAWQRYLSLVEAVAVLHEEGIMHRSISPGVVRALTVDDADVIIDGFQLSGFVATWLRTKLAREESSTFLPADASERLFLAPERLGPLLGQERRSLESYATDVFSLGMLGIWWFMGFAGFPDADDVFRDGRYDEDRHRRLIAALHQQLGERGLPRSLVRLLKEMTAHSPRNRPPSARSVFDEVCRIYGSVLRELEQSSEEGKGEGGRNPLSVLYLQESIERFYDSGMGRSDPESADYEEYNTLLQQDLVDGVVTWSPTGFEPWQRGANKEGARRARAVLLGQHYAYFCQYLNAGQADEDRCTLLVKHMLDVSRGKELRHQPRQVALPSVRAAHFTPGGIRRKRQASRSWEPILRSVEFVDSRVQARPLVEAATWLHQVLSAQLSIEEYPCTVVEQNHGRVVLRGRMQNDADWNDDSESAAFAKLWLRGAPPEPMGKFFARLQDLGLESGDEPEFLLRAHRNRQGEDTKLRFVDRLDDWTVRFEFDEPGARPDRDRELYIRQQDRASRTVLGRQWRALELVKRRFQHLGSQLVAPAAVAVPEETSYTPANVDETTTTLIQRILETWPLFALQGPPGTGKSFVARHVVTGILRADPFARVLVAAQSHHALDNLLESVAKSSSDVEPTNSARLLRLASVRTEAKVSTVGREHLFATVLRRAVDAIKTAPEPTDTTLTKLRNGWKRLAKKGDLDLDLAQRLRRSASVVFATCAGATSEALGAANSSVSFDWVVIEEAARGWVTEMLVPMVNGSRWLLIGDHEQLPAYNQHTITGLLSRDIADELTSPVTGSPVSDSFKPFLSYFQRLNEVEVLPHREDPRGRLQVQRRMHPDIGHLISRAYYDGGLETHHSAVRAHGLRRPEVLRNTGLLWIDTSEFGPTAYESSYVNNCEVQLLQYAIAHNNHDFATHDEHIPPIAVLSPYTKQMKLMREKIRGIPTSAFHTVDSFQGREAEVVLLSLVRNNSSDTENGGLGFLVESNRVNVMFSRARRLLVIVGSLDHFSRFPSTHWARVVDYIRGDPRFVVKASDLGFKWGNW